MADPSDDIARRAAQRLGLELDRNLPALVEARIQGGGAIAKRYELVTLVALAALVVTVAKYTWDIYRDLKKDAKAAPSAEVIARTIRLELKGDGSVTIEQRDRVISVVVEEATQAPPKS